MESKLRFEAQYPYPRERVWVALTDPVAMADWLMPNDFKAELGHEFTFRTRPAPGFDGIVRCEVIEIWRPRMLAFRWEGGGIDTIVRFELLSEDESSRLVMEQSGFTGLRGWIISRLLRGGWKRMIHKRLRAAASRVVGNVYHTDPHAGTASPGT